MSHHHPGPPGRSLARRTAGLAAAAALALQGCAGSVPSAEPEAAPPTSPTAASTSPTVEPSPEPPPTSAAYELERFESTAHEGWLTQIPDGLRVDGQLPEPGGDFSRSRSGVGFTFCGEEAFSAGRVFDRATASASGPEYGESRDLRVFASNRAAHRFSSHVLTVVTACPDQDSQGTTWRNEVRKSHLDGDTSFTVVQSFFTHDDFPVLGANFWEVARVGNAVLLTASGGEYEPTTNLDPGIRDHAGEVAQIVEEMCVFAAERCHRPPVNGTSTQSTIVGPGDSATSRWATTRAASRASAAR